MAKQRSLYLDKAQFANVPLSERKQVIVGRAGQRRVVRRHHLMPSQIALIKARILQTGRFVSPYGANRLYTLMIDSVAALGENQVHGIGEVFAKFREIANDPCTLRGHKTAWDRFSKREARNEKTHRDALARFVANLEVLQRLGGDHPYGLKLAQLGACIDLLIDKQTKIIQVRLRTNIVDGAAVIPVNENRKRKHNKVNSLIVSGLVVDVEQSATLAQSCEQVEEGPDSDDIDDADQD